MVGSSLKKQAQREEKDSDLSDRLVTVLDPHNGASEDYRTLRTNLLYALVDTPPKVIVITSPGPTEGKSTTCANLAVVLAQADQSTLIVDCDLRKSAMHRIFGARNFTGVVDVLVGEHGLSETWQELLPRLKMISAGPIPPNPAELLGSKRFAQLIGQAREQFDYVLIDAPPTGPVSDPIILSTQGDGVLLVFDSQNTRKGAFRQAMRSLESVGANVLGTVMNNVKTSKGGYYNYAYYNYAYK